MNMPKPLQLLFLLIALVLVTVSLPACTLPVRYTSEPLPLPARPLLPALTAADLTCLSDDAYRRLVTRDLLRRQYAEELEAIIGATRAPEKKARNPPEE